MAALTIATARVPGNEISDSSIVFYEVMARYSSHVRGRNTRDIAFIVFIEPPVSDCFRFRHLHGDVEGTVAAVCHLSDDLLLRLLHFGFGQPLVCDLTQLLENCLFNFLWLNARSHGSVKREESRIPMLIGIGIRFHRKVRLD